MKQKEKGGENLIKINYDEYKSFFKRNDYLGDGSSENMSALPGIETATLACKGSTLTTGLSDHLKEGACHTRAPMLPRASKTKREKRKKNPANLCVTSQGQGDPN